MTADWVDYHKDSLVKKSIITIRIKGDLSCGRALAVGQVLPDKCPKLQQFKLGRPIQKKVALELCKKANVLPGPCGLLEVLLEYLILVINEDPHHSKKIMLYKHGDHLNVINLK